MSLFDDELKPGIIPWKEFRELPVNTIGRVLSTGEGLLCRQIGSLQGVTRDWKRATLQGSKPNLDEEIPELEEILVIGTIDRCKLCGQEVRHGR